MRERGFDTIVDGELSADICLSFMILNASRPELFKREVNKEHVTTSFLRDLVEEISHILERCVLKITEILTTAFLV